MTVINTNVKSLIAQDSLIANNKKLATAMERLSTGKRINSAADDAAGLAISSRMDSQIRGLNMAVRNANDGISLMQTAEGALEESTSILQRMRELAVQGANSTYSNADRAQLQMEVEQLSAELTRISETTQFNGQSILDGSYTNKQLQIGANANQTIDFSLNAVSAAVLGQRADGPATAAARALLEIQGMSNNAADYQSKSFNVDLNGTSATVSLPAPLGATVTAAVASGAAVGEDAGPATSMVVGNQSFRAETIDLSAHANRVFELRVGSQGYVTVDLTNELADILGVGITELNAPTSYSASSSDEVTQTQFLAALQSAIDNTGAFTGDKAVTVSIDPDGLLNMSVADGSFLSMREATIGASTAGTFIASFVDSALTQPLGAVDLSAHANTGFKLTVNGGTATNVEFSDLLDDPTMVFDRSAVTADELVNVLQTRFDELFTGDDALTVSVDNEGFLNIKVAGGLEKVVIAEITAMANGVTGASTGGVTLFKTLGTIDNNDLTVNLDSKGINAVVTPFDDPDLVMTVEVNGLDKVNIDMTTYIRAAASDVSAIRQDEMVTALQAAFDANFTGENAVTVTGYGDGKIGFEVAGGAGYLKLSEYDPVDGTSDGTFVATAIATSGSLTVNPNLRPTDSAYAYKGSALYSDSRTASATPLFDLTFTQYGADNNTTRIELFSDQNRQQTGAMTVAGTWAAGDTIALASAGTVVSGSASYTVTAADVADSTFETLARNIASFINADSNLGDKFLATATGAVVTVSAMGETPQATAYTTLTPTISGSGTLSTGTFSSLADLEITSGSNNTLTVELANSGVTNSLTITDGEYANIEALAAEINLQIAKSDAFEGDNAIRAVVYSGFDNFHTDTPSDLHKYLVIESPAGKQIELTGNFVTTGLFFGSERNSEIDSTRILSSLGAGAYDVATHGLRDGGVDTTAGSGIVSVSIQDGSTTVSKQVVLGNQSATRSFADFASDLGAAVNAAFAADGYSVTTSYANGQLQVALDQAGSKTMSLSGAIIEDAFGGAVSGTGYSGDIANLQSMGDVVAEINADLAAGGVGVTASYDNNTNKLVFQATSGVEGSGSVITLSGADLAELQFGSTLSASGTDGNATAAAISSIDISTFTGATTALESIDNAITYISNERSRMGAIQNRLEHTVTNLMNVSSNTSASMSRIVDTDYAVETSALAKNQILTQAATAMLAQANQSAQSVLSLLQ
jgi:flagellin